MFGFQLIVPIFLLNFLFVYKEKSIWLRASKILGFVLYIIFINPSQAVVMNRFEIKKHYESGAMCFLVICMSLNMFNKIFKKKFTPRISFFSFTNRLVLNTFVDRISRKKNIVKVVQWYIIFVFWSFVCHWICSIKYLKKSSHHGLVFFLSPID